MRTRARLCGILTRAHSQTTAKCCRYYSFCTLSSQCLLNDYYYCEFILFSSQFLRIILLLFALLFFVPKWRKNKENWANEKQHLMRHTVNRNEYKSTHTEFYLSDAISTHCARPVETFFFLCEKPFRTKHFKAKTKRKVNHNNNDIKITQMLSHKKKS